MTFSLRLTALLLAVAATTPECPAGPAPPVTGSWGGEHLLLVASDSGATLEFDCAHGTIAGAIVVKSSGDFTATGTHTREHGGPVREGEAADVHPAAYTGKVRGDEMTISGRETDTGLDFGTYTVRRGVNARVYKCL